ncbi:hypothetical protein HMPREF1141_0792 [Clostridium sp. MSTE9]|nr:hypothetical protein HMPREF1141_0792 [Clostridium sp. MSTE9]
MFFVDRDIANIIFASLAAVDILRDIGRTEWASSALWNAL